MLELRAGRHTDLDALLAMNNAAVPAVNGLNDAELSDLVDQSAALIVADAEAELAGFLLLLDGPGLSYESLNYGWFSDRFDSFLYVDRIVVGSTAKRAGVGRRLYEYALSFGAGRYPVLCAEVNTKPRNDESLAFHEAFGFEEVGTQDTEGGAKTVRLLARRLDG